MEDIKPTRVNYISDRQIGWWTSHVAYLSWKIRVQTVRGRA